MLPVYVAAWTSLTLLAPVSPTGANSAVVSSALCDARRLPPSIDIDRGLGPVVGWMLEYSPTFRQQCRVLASVPNLAARVRVTWRRLGGQERAHTVVRRAASGALTADIEIGAPFNLSELLGHEFEHLIEQVDGVNLSALERSGEAHTPRQGIYETDRAMAAGRQVAGEVVDNAPDRLRHASASLWRRLRRVVVAGR
jgi:hypothetical protein